MKKLEIVSFIAIIIATIALAMLRVTGMPVHIAVSVIALIIMVLCAILGRKNWSVPALEILYRLFYLISLITGIVMIKAQVFGPVSIAHKLCSGIFAGIFIINFIIKMIAKKKGQN